MHAAAVPAVVPVQPALRQRRLGRIDYTEALAAMRQFTAQRSADTPDELWLLEHPPVYTRGLGADPAHGPRVAAGAEQQDCIPVVSVERGGEITYHGPGQVVLYTLVDLARRNIKVREFVRLLESGVIELLAAHGVLAECKAGAPGVYVDGAKVAALGLRITRGRALHGLALNVDMDLAPFGAIDPCGYPGLKVTQTRELGIAVGAQALGEELVRRIAAQLEAQHA